MGVLLDIVPNHMAWDSANPWWMDILENGPASPYARFYAIDWHSPLPNLSGRLLLPFLGEPSGRALENRKLTLTFENGAFCIDYYDLRLPLLPESYRLILEHRGEVLRRLLPEGSPERAELAGIVAALRHLPPATASAAEERTQRQREKEAVKGRLAALCRECDEVRTFLEENVRLCNGRRGHPASFALLERLLEAQLWRLAHWSVAAEEINYRRFFDINQLAALRMEDPAVFAKTHALVLRLIAEGTVTGLRIDHPDGLHDPEQYLERLQGACFSRLAAPGSAADREQREEVREVRQIRAHPPETPAGRSFYIVVEKILAEEERLPEAWPVFGTTGYDHLNLVTGLFVEGGNAGRFTALYRRFTGSEEDFPALRHAGKRLVMDMTMAGDIHNLACALAAIAGRHRHGRDYTLRGLTRALSGVIACFPVYRSYIHSPAPGERDCASIAAAVEEAKGKAPWQAEIFDFIGDILLLRFPAGLGEEDRRQWLAFVMRFQQTTAPVMAKGVEDTALYVYNRLLSLNEVGGSPERFGLSVAAFHDRNKERFKSWPQGLNASSTHDTKRGEDVRARLAVLSEIPERWEQCLLRWSGFNARQKTTLAGRTVPDANEEYLLYQTLIGAWPAGPFPGGESEEFKRRIRDYMRKALREAKIHSNWIRPAAGYESAVASFIEAILAAGPDNAFLQDFEPFQRTVSAFGMVNSLSQVLLKIASPGVPDFFQGTELWDFSLVDPDNRRAVDFADRQARLASLNREMANSGADFSGFLGRLLARWEEGTVKLYLTRRALHCRRENRALFREGAYVPLSCEGERKGHICAFARQDGATAVLIVVPRLLARFLPFACPLPAGGEIWKNTALVLPEGLAGTPFHNVLTGERVEAGRSAGKRLLPLASLLSLFPVAMLATAGDVRKEGV
jgi:(1->4)-alpha-D-glucan 1-alpha-D-glucosylmutase